MGTPTSRDYKGVPGDNVQMASLPRMENGHCKSGVPLSIAVALLPTPNTMDDLSPKTPEQIAAHRKIAGDRNLREAVLYEIPPAGAHAHVEPLSRWGKYDAAIRRWEAMLGRSAPEPTEPGREGKPRLSPAFTEWMMGLPEGWVTSSGIDRKGQLHALGNGVVPQQAVFALKILMEMR